MRIVLDTKKITSPVAKFFARTAKAVQTKRLERCARILATVEAKKAEKIIGEQSLRVVAERDAKLRKSKGGVLAQMYIDANQPKRTRAKPQAVRAKR